MKIALKEQLYSNNDKLKLLLSTWSINLIHKPMKSDGSYYLDSITLPWEIFSRFLIELREEFKDLDNNVWIVKDQIKNVL